MENLHIRSAQGNYLVHFRDSLSSIVETLLSAPPTVIVAVTSSPLLYQGW